MSWRPGGGPGGEAVGGAANHLVVFVDNNHLVVKQVQLRVGFVEAEAEKRGLFSSFSAVKTHPEISPTLTQLVLRRFLLMFLARNYGVINVS